jgi:hypothetical protein
MAVTAEGPPVSRADEPGWSRRVAAPARRALLVLLPLAATVLVYRAVAGSYFFSDDFVDLLQIAERGADFVFVMWGGHLLVLRNLVFYLTERLCGFDPLPYYRMLLLTHLVNVWLLFRVIRAFTEDAPLAAFGATSWGTSPLCVGTIGWYAVYGHVLATTILLVVLADVGRVAVHRAPVGGRRIAGWCLLLLLGTTCFGVGIGLAIVFPLTVLLVAPTGFGDTLSRVALIALPIAAVALYFGYRLVVGAVTPLPMSEVIVVRLGVSRFEPILTMVGHLLAFGLAGLVLGFFFSPAGYPGPGSRVVVLVCFAVFVVALAAVDGRGRRRLVGLLLLALAVDAMIAIGRANLYLSQGLGWPAIARQMRYYYAGLVPLVLVACVMLKECLTGLRMGLRASAAILVAWLAIAGYGYARSSWRVDQRADVRRYVESSLRTMDAVVDAADATDAYVPNRPVPSTLLGPGNPPVSFPGWAALFVVAHPEAPVVRSRRVHFVEPDSALASDVVASGLHPKLAAMLVTDRAAVPR